MEASNAKAMREALLAIKDVAEREMRHHVSMSESDGTSIRAWSNLFVSLASKALAAPLRNCDVGTPEERMCRYNRLREELNERYKRLGEIPPSFAFPTAFEWEDRPYEEGDAEWEKNKRRQA